MRKSLGAVPGEADAPKVEPKVETWKKLFPVGDNVYATFLIR